MLISRIPLFLWTNGLTFFPNVASKYTSSLNYTETILHIIMYKLHSNNCRNRVLLEYMFAGIYVSQYNGPDPNYQLRKTLPTK